VHLCDEEQSKEWLKNLKLPVGREFQNFLHADTIVVVFVEGQVDISEDLGFAGSVLENLPGRG